MIRFLTSLGVLFVLFLIWCVGVMIALTDNGRYETPGVAVMYTAGGAAVLFIGWSIVRQFQRPKIE